MAKKISFFGYYNSMKCTSNYLAVGRPMQNHEKINNLWEVRFSPEKSAQIVTISLKNEITLSMSLRYCVFRLIEEFNRITDTSEQFNQIMAIAKDSNLDNLKIKQRKPINDLKHYSVLDLKHYEEGNSQRLCTILDTIDQCKLEKTENNQNAHRFMVCLYGQDEFLLRAVAARMCVTVSLLFRVAVEMFLHELEGPNKVDDENLLKYAIKQVFVTQFHNKQQSGQFAIGNFMITAIHFPRWKFWPIRRPSDAFRD